MKIKLIPDWKKAWKLSSVYVSLIGSAVISFLLLFPDALLQIWTMMPDDLKSRVPEKIAVYVSLVFLVGAAVARVIKQQSLEKPNEENQNENQQ